MISEQVVAMLIDTRDFTIGFHDAEVALRHLKNVTSEPIDLNDVLEYIYKNFGTHRYRDCQESYLAAIEKAFDQQQAPAPGMTSESPAIQEGNMESGANSYNH